MTRKDYILDKFNTAISSESYEAAFFYYKEMLYRNLLSGKEATHFSSLLNGHALTNIADDKEFFEYWGQFHSNFSAYQEANAIKKAPIQFENEEEFMSFVSPRIEFQNNKKSLLDIGYSNPFITRDDIIKAATEQDSRDSENAAHLIDQVWGNKYYNALFTLLAIFVAEGKQFKILFSDHLNLQFFTSHLETDYKFDTFVHESYHALQTFIFNGKDYHNQKVFLNDMIDTRKEFLSAFCKTCVNIIKAISYGTDLSDVNTHDHTILASLLLKLLPSRVSYCYSGIIAEVQNEASLDDINTNQIIQDINNGQNFTSHNEVIVSINNYCSAIDKQFGVPSYVLERIMYFITNADIKDDNFPEVIPAIFELMAQGVDQKHLNMFEPMLAYVDEQILPIIEEYKQLHIEYNCAPLLDEINNQCLQTNYALAGLQCISDFIE